jgi:hypothetical protein
MVDGRTCPCSQTPLFPPSPEAAHQILRHHCCLHRAPHIKPIHYGNTLSIQDNFLRQSTPMLLISLIHEHHIYIHICEEAKYVNLPVSLKNPCAKCFTPPIPPVLPHIPALPTVVPAQVAVSPSIRVCCPNWVRHPTMAICTFVHFHKGNSSHSGYTSYRVMIHACIHTYIHT